MAPPQFVPLNVHYHDLQLILTVAPLGGKITRSVGIRRATAREQPARSSPSFNAE